MDVPTAHLLQQALAENGFADQDFRTLVRSGEWRRVRHGAYATDIPHDARQRHLQLVAATWPQLHSRSVLSHTSAAVLHGLPVFDDALAQVWTTRSVGGHGRSTRWLRVSHAPLADEEIVTMDGLLVTSLVRTTVDLARTQPFRRAVAVVDRSLRHGSSADDLLDVLARHPKRHGVARAARAVEFADPRSESVGESESRVVIRQLGLPAPQLQYEVRHGGVLLGRSDFAWEEERLLGEFDGRIKYSDLLKPGESPADVVMREKQREQRLRNAGWWVVRWGYDSLVHPERLRSTILAGFAQARAFTRLAG